MSREVPKESIDKWLAWKRFSGHWQNIHYFTGFGSAALAVVIAANSQKQFLSPILTTLIAGLAAGLAFLVTTMGAQTKAKSFELAARELEAAIARYRFDPSLQEPFLGAAEAKGIPILNSMK
jgi:hypothetical protein